MSNSRKPLQLFELPDWARWFAWIELSPKLKVQVLSLKFPRWGIKFYPIFLNQDHLPLFKLPRDLSEVAKDERVWSACPPVVFYSDKTSQVVVDTLWEGDHPRPAGAERQLVSPPDFTATTVESLCSSYGENYMDAAGDVVPKLPALGPDFQERKVDFFEDDLQPVKAEPASWPIEKPRPKSNKKNRS